MKTARILLIALCCTVFAGIASANTLKDRPPTIFYPEGHYLEGWPRKAHRDMFGYNYQQHRIIGHFVNVYLGGDGLPPYGGNDRRYYRALVKYGYVDTVEEAKDMMNSWWYWDLRRTRIWMFWNDAWLSNQDRADSTGGGEPDGDLDRHYGLPNYFDSGAELVQYQIEPVLVKGKHGRKRRAFLYYCSKIVAVPSSAELIDGIWYTAEGEEIGPVSFGQFAKVKEFLYDPRDKKPAGDNIAATEAGDEQSAKPAFGFDIQPEQ